VDATFSESGDMLTPPVRTITKAELLEVSVVTIPANNDAMIDSIKSASLRDAAAFSDLPAGVVEMREFPAADGSKGKPDITVNVRKHFGEEWHRLAHTILEGSDLRPILQHSAVVDGEMRTVKQMVRLAMAQVVARDHDLTDEQREAAWSSLAKRWKGSGLDGDSIPTIDRWPAPGQFAAIAGEWPFRFDREEFTEKQATAWLDSHGYKSVKVYAQGAHWITWTDGVKGSEPVDLGNGVQAVGLLATDEAPEEDASMGMTNEQLETMINDKVDARVAEREAETAAEFSARAAAAATGADADTANDDTTPDTDEIGDEEIEVSSEDLAIVEAAASGNDEALAQVSDEAFEQAAQRVAAATGLVDEEDDAGDDDSEGDSE
jgi:hypothetical protein